MNRSIKTTPSFSSVDDYERLRKVLDTAGYTDKGVIEALGVKDSPSLSGHDLPVLLRRTGQGTPVDLFVRLFLMEVPVDRSALQHAIQPIKLEAWSEGGLVETDGESVIATVRLLPFEGFLLAFDLERHLFSQSGSDYVMGIAASSLTLASHTVRRHARTTLDLGAGCGIQALLAASHSDRVLAVDRNPRAVGIAAFNAKLNRLPSIDCREGDLFEPVKDEKFDLIISNPPFVISPDIRYIYRDSGMEGDQICQKIVRQAPQFLNEGGFCQILCNWAEYSGQDWRERLAGWFAGTGCDAWVMRSETQDTARYASMWIRHTERLQGDDYARRFDEWMAYYDRQDIEAVSAGFISFRRSPKQSNWFRAEDGLGKKTEACGDAILRGFELRDFLETVRDDETLLNMRLHVSPDVRLEQQYAPSDGTWVGTVAKLSLVKGLDYSGEADPHVAKLIGACDGSRTLGELLVEMATSLGVEPAKIRPAFLQFARRFIERGFILPSDFQS